MKYFRVRFEGPFLAESKEDAIAQMRKALGSNIIAAIDVQQCTKETCVTNYNPDYKGPWEPVACYLDGSKA